MLITIPVRKAEPRDREPILEICRQNHAENGQFALSMPKVEAMVDKAFNRGGAITAGYGGSTSTGSILNTYLGGLRVRGRTRRKMNLWVRNPELTAPGI